MFIDLQVLDATTGAGAKNELVCNPQSWLPGAMPGAKTNPPIPPISLKSLGEAHLLLFRPECSCDDSSREYRSHHAEATQTLAPHIAELWCDVCGSSCVQAVSGDAFFKNCILPANRVVVDSGWG